MTFCFVCFDFVLAPNPPSGVELSGVTCASASFKWSDPNRNVDESFVYHCERSYDPPMEIKETRGLAFYSV